MTYIVLRLQEFDRSILRCSEKVRCRSPKASYLMKSTANALANTAFRTRSLSRAPSWN